MKKSNLLILLSFALISGCSEPVPLQLFEPVLPNTTVSSEQTNVAKATSKEIAASLQKASSGLLYLSESDYPYKSFLWSGQASTPMTNEKILKILNKKPGTLIEVRTLDYFFEDLITDDPSYTPEEKQDVLKYRNILKIIKGNLTDVKVYRVGEIEIGIYIVGKNGADFLGLSTVSIET